MNKKQIKNLVKKTWNFIWNDDSIESWIVNIVLAYILVRFIIYPGIGLVFGTSYPIVAVISSSMEHNGQGFDSWWEINSEWYVQQGFTKEDFKKYDFHNGFNKGDIIFLHGPSNIQVGDIAVYIVNQNVPPVIHRIVYLDKDYIQTKGDNVDRVQSFEEHINRNLIIGKAWLKIPYLGWVKIWFVDFVGKPYCKLTNFWPC